MSADNTRGSVQWIWQQQDWPVFRWDADVLASALREATQLQGRLLGKADVITDRSAVESELDTLLQNVVESSAIEGEQLNVESVRSSLARRLKVPVHGQAPVTAQTEGLAELVLDATQNYDANLDYERLFQWHKYLFPETDDFSLNKIEAGQLRGAETMQVVSGRVDHPVVHFEAPPKTVLEEELQAFLEWFESSREDTSLDPLLRAGIAHFWFVTIHPFEDGNGRLARAITDLALAQAENMAIRFYAMSASIMANRNSYYEILESSQKGTVDITRWLEWFLKTLTDSLQNALGHIDLVLQKARFWHLHSQDGLSHEQVKVLNRLLDAGPGGFEGGLTASKYKSLAKVSKATATRHLSDLLDKKCLIRSEAGGRSTRYEVNWP